MDPSSRQCDNEGRRTFRLFSINQKVFQEECPRPDLFRPRAFFLTNETGSKHNILFDKWSRHKA
ncbi:hypothetical protein GCWU000342_00197 [Shuttleworthella satelles DSM 14600]|uniref:Uncharacterized protein n=1 Tax=Shuttleworthella satelles DSM 14600 TaxID=626523 RepID=C4G833_9FIRM|nr:hypothetical protein GCWU000342_00197 [Shuttleworthia satelles DSM 14600]